MEDHWLKENKDGSKRWDKSKKGGGAKGKAMRAEIEGYCHRLVEEQEEALQTALFSKELNSTNVEDLLCRKFTKECKGKKIPRPAAGEDGDKARCCPFPSHTHTHTHINRKPATTLICFSSLYV